MRTRENDDDRVDRQRGGAATITTTTIVKGIIRTASILEESVQLECPCVRRWGGINYGRAEGMEWRDEGGRVATHVCKERL